VPSAREVADAVMDAFARETIANRSVGHAGIRELAESTGDREALKLCLMILGAIGDETDNPLLKLVGMHGEFTPFAATGISMANPEPATVLLELASTTGGWGRVTIIEALLRHRTAAVDGYLLRRGFSGLMTELAAEVAWDVATACDLASAIDIDSPDEELVRGVGTILETLATSPFKDLGDYAQGAAGAAAFLRHFEPLAATIQDFDLVATLHDRAAIEPGGERTALPWTAEERVRVVDLAKTILDRPGWREAVVAAFEDPSSRFLAVHLAKRFDLPTRERLIAWLRHEPLESSWWYLLCVRPTAEEIDEILTLAREILDVEAIATGPADDLGLGPGFERDSCVGYIAQALKGIPSLGGRPAIAGFPGRGEEVLFAALRSRVVRNRRLAISALEAWPADSITGRLRAAVEALTRDPNEGARQQAVALLDRIGSTKVH
jgi:hypothetical protein